MIIKSRVTGKWVLSVFENFRIDRLLPKYTPKKEDKDGIFFKNTDDVLSSAVVNMSSWRVSDNGGYEKTPWKLKLLWRIEKFLGLSPAKREVVPSGKMNPLEILLSVHGSLKEAQDYINRLNLYDEVIKQAKEAGQIARLEQLMIARKIVQLESMLIAAGFGKYMSEDTAVEFATKCQKGLRLDWVCNFTRPIPPDILAKKVEIDRLQVFDNYVIMHYDPDAQAFALTKQQEEAKKDPILFGVIEGVRKLYYIGDWKDDVCSLTMEEVETVLGRSLPEIDKDPTLEA